MNQPGAALPGGNTAAFALLFCFFFKKPQVRRYGFFLFPSANDVLRLRLRAVLLRKGVRKAGALSNVHPDEANGRVVKVNGAAVNKAES